MTAKEVKSLENANEAQFEYLYQGAKIEFIGTVKQIKTNYRYKGAPISYDSIEFEEGWLVELLSGSEENLLLKMNPGTKVSVSSNIKGCHIWVNIMGTSPSGSYSKDTIRTTRISIIE